MLTVSLHAMYWVLGALVLTRRLGSHTDPFGAGSTWIAAWAIGLSLHLPVVFTLNQLVGLSLSPAWLLGSAGVLIALAAIALPRDPGARRPPTHDERSPAHGWALPAAVGLAAVVAVFADRHLLMLFSPLQDWDSFLYHLPYGRLVAAGTFPADIAPDYAHVAAAYPPLFYFLYGLNFHLVDSVTTIDLTYVAPKTMVVIVDALLCGATWSLARRRLGLGRVTSALALLWLVLLLNWKPNIQSVTVLFCVLALDQSWPGAWATRSGAGRSGPPDWVAGAVLWAGCAWSNYTGLFLTGAFFAGLLVVRALPARDTARSPWLEPAALVGVLLAPFLVRNWIVAGNPVFPALLDVIGGVGATPWWLANDHVLRNAPTTRASLPLAFHDARGAAPVILAAFGALAAARTCDRATRVVPAVLVGGFVLVWLVLLQPTWAVAWRHLQPVVPVAAVLAASALERASRHGGWSGVASVSHWPVLAVMTALAPQTRGAFAASLALAVALPLAAFAASRRIRASCPPGFVAIWLVFVAAAMTAAIDLDTISSVHSPRWLVPPWPWLVVPVVAAWLAVTVASVARDRSIRASVRPREGRGLSGRALAALLVGVVGVVAFVRFEPSGFTDYRLDIRQDLEWMNRHLPEDAVVLTLEDRLFTLERRSVQASHYSLEAFYEATSPAESLAELQRRGITHVYLTRSPIFRQQGFFFAKRMLFPRRGNPYVELLHASPTGAVVAVRDR